MLKEVLLIFLGVLGTLKVLYEFRHVGFTAKYLPTFAALILIYPPVIHTTFRRIPLSFFEKNRRSLLSSLRLFAVTTLVVMPPFLLLNHFYQKFFFHRTLDWMGWKDLKTLILVQFFLVAFPEEFFFRGYLQPMIEKTVKFCRKRILFRPLKLSFAVSVPVTAFLFALSHSLIALQWWHFAIFFPSLLFGWLREKTGALTAPILFHAVSNIAIAWIGTAYH